MIRVLLKRTARLLNASRIILTHPSVLRPRKYVFVLSHMRGYTSLLTHILGSHREISGYAEASISYGSAVDLLKLRCSVYHHGGYKPKGTYYLDKILHNKLPISDGILERDDIRYVFMVRKPLATVKSTIELRRHNNNKKASINRYQLPPATIEEVVFDYIERLKILVTVGETLHRLGKLAVVVRAEDLIDAPRRVLDRIGGFLDLKVPLDEQYSVFVRTGEAGFGDTSHCIRSGKIQRERRSYPELSIPDHLLIGANRNYEQCLSELSYFFPFAPDGSA